MPNMALLKTKHFTVYKQLAKKECCFCKNCGDRLLDVRMTQFFKSVKITAKDQNFGGIFIY